MITVAIRRVNLGQNKDEPSLLEVISPDRYTMLPNTAGCYTAEDAVRTCRMARELLDGHKLIKLEVLGDQKNLYPNVTETLAAAEILVADGFDVKRSWPVVCQDAFMPVPLRPSTGLSFSAPSRRGLISH